MAGLPNVFISSLNQTLNVGGNDTSISLSTIFTQDGQVVTTADFAQYGRGIITVNPVSLSGIEFISFTGITATTPPTGTLTGCQRGLSFKGNNQIAANQKFNVIGTPVIISFGTQNLLDIPALAGTNAFTGLNNFPSGSNNPTIGNSYVAPTTDLQIATKKYVDETAIFGAPLASTTTFGITQLATAPVSPTNPIAVGDNDPRVANPLTVAYGGTGLQTLTAHALQVGAGTSAPTQLGLGTTTTVLHGNASGDPTFAAVSLTADVSGVLPVANGGTGTTGGADGPVGAIGNATVDGNGHQVTRDSIIYGYASKTTVTNEAASVSCYTDSASTPTTLVSYQVLQTTTSAYSFSFCFFVKAGNYYKISLAGDFATNVAQIVSFT